MTGLCWRILRRDIPRLGIEPTASTAAAAKDRDINTIEEFFGVELANKLAGAGTDRQTLRSLITSWPMYPISMISFSGFARLLKPHGVATFEFPHLLKLVEENQFDTIYHEHFSYLSLTAVEQIFEANGLGVFDIEELTHPWWQSAGIRPTQ
ncbi:MAG: hypothetical protein U5K34_10490 [Thiohalophilus sp.]|nr:hypothetical protein [Thiohalophilus sp.]MDZ7804394.1 hypothetical protein [Thiohalophilus sp.]